MTDEKRVYGDDGEEDEAISHDSTKQTPLNVNTHWLLLVFRQNSSFG